MKFYFVYILKCSDDSFYAGFTSNLDQRLAEHQMGKSAGYTSKRLPLELVWFEQFLDYPEQAIQWEKRIKGWSRRKKQALIDGNWDNLILFSKNYAEYGNKIKRVED
ncbi:tRNA/rRNA methyltransferase/putative endonuclease [Nonlabens sp. Hel1_33_55]|uniref:GIY-YIG nuclease family protein n=1 Tax=Nonlabens sp. Hel1_33_55 TaxID=1336802 RepID=UPI000875AD50|nr:GIY-YIG nuclease family protein [Nonlabens sp. Hel1_33_55]SCY30862.1 tRNA/rRNA methyltransferase/putative endonuclease [Nonlabens sp. Hel1_33_55]